MQFTPSGPSEVDPRIALAAKVIARQVSAGTPSLEMVAGLLNISVSRLRHLFREQVGMSPRRYMKLLKLERARMLVETSHLEIKEVMGQAGLGDISHSVRDFKIKFGVSPQQLRRAGARMNCA